MDKSILIQYVDMQKEIKDTEKRLDRLRNKSSMVSDVVQNGYKRHAVICGIDIYRQQKIYEQEANMKKFYDNLLQKQIEVEEWIEKIEKPKIRQIFRHRYLDGMTWYKIANIMGYSGESIPRMQHDRYLE